MADTPPNPLAIGGRNLLAGLAGIVSGIVVIYLIELLTQQLYPPPAFDPADTAALSAYINKATRPLLMVLVAYFTGAFTSVYVSLHLSANKTILLPIAMVVFLLLSYAMNVAQIPHPLWFVITAPIALMVGGLLGYRGGHTK